MPVSDRKFWWRSWLCFFFYSAAAAIFIQFLLLPYVFPAWHAGHGLIKGHDWVTYHRIGIELAQLIHKGEWDNWVNAEIGWVEPRVLSILYAKVWPEPWVLIPFNAFFHATTTLLLAFIFLTFVPSNRVAALAGALPFLLFPSSLLWVAQVHKDGATNFALVCYLLGWVLLYRYSKTLNLKRFLTIFSLICFGSLFAWSLRPYLGFMLTTCSAVFLTIGAVFYFPHPIAEKKLGASLLSILLSVIALYPLLAKNSYQNLEAPRPIIELEEEPQTAETLAVPPPSPPKIDQPLITQSVTEEPEAQVMSQSVESQPVEQPANLSEEQTPTYSSLSGISEALESPQSQPKSKASLQARLPTKQNLAVSETKKNDEIVLVPENAWYPSPVIPAFIESKAFAVARVRNGFINTGLGKSNIDTNIRFHSIWDILAYTPRALQVALLTPFPEDWFKPGSTEYNSFFKKITIPEMLFVYLLLPCFLVCLVKKYKQREMIVVFLFSAMVLLLFGCTVANVGTLYRFRYFFLLTWAGLGLSYLTASYQSVLKAWKKVRESFSSLKYPQTEQSLKV